MTMDYEKPGIRTLTMDDVHKLIGALALELDQARRENAALRARLETAGQANHDDRRVPREGFHAAP
jgi:hypothetical protein